MDKHAEELRKFAAALLDVDRLKIVGELAKGNDRPAAITAQIGLGPDALDAHLRALVETGLVHRRETTGDDDRYSLDDKALEEMSRRQFARARKLAEAPDHRRIDEQFTPEQAKFIRSFTDPNGVITHLPSIHADAKLQAVLQYALQGIEPGRVYTEPEFNQALAPFTRDPATVRRHLVDYRYVDRKTDGSAYWLREAGDDR
ncbi:MAG TPA: DUF2087 domain-containing protein [Anaerolineales bacterium]|nr:DUF2087 domain-containing protein [Anaerolineales bacterium]